MHGAFNCVKYSSNYYGKKRQNKTAYDINRQVEYYAFTEKELTLTIYLPLGIHVL